MSSVLKESNVDSGQINYDLVLKDLSKKLQNYNFSENKIEFAAKVVEAEYLHKHQEEDLGNTDGLLSQVGTDNFEKILNGAKQEIDEDLYNLGKAYLMKTGSEIIEEDAETFAENMNISIYNLKSGNPEDWFRSNDFTEDKQNYSAKYHKGVNPEYISNQPTN